MGFNLKKYIKIKNRKIDDKSVLYTEEDEKFYFELLEQVKRNEELMKETQKNKKRK